MTLRVTPAIGTGLAPGLALGLALGMALSGCASNREPAAPPPLPLSVGTGMGSQYGNYPAVQGGEMVDAQGRRCVVWVWDRPLTSDLALRLRSASCVSTERPGAMVAIELDRTIIRIADSPVLVEEMRTNPGPMAP